MPNIYSKLHGVTSSSFYPGGKPEHCRVDERNYIETSCGKLIPRYSPPDMRRKELKSVSFYESGAVRSISLEAQTDITTPLGIFPAELVTFYEDGALESVFPLDGQIGFGWSEKEEKTFAKDVEFDFSFGSFTIKPVGLRFYNGGELRSLILWPGERIRVKTPVGYIPVRIGFRLYESGELESVEPAEPVSVPTPIGAVKAYDENALALDAEINSLHFSENGEIKKCSTTGDALVVNRVTGERKIFSSLTRLGISDKDIYKLPIEITFDGGTATFDDKTHVGVFAQKDCDFLFMPGYGGNSSSCDSGCDGCTGCG